VNKNKEEISLILDDPWKKSWFL